MLEAIDLTKRYGGTLALDKLRLRIDPGEVYALLGPNGAGKTTTIHLFLGFLAADAGRARVGNLDVAERPLEARRLLGYIPEQVTLYGNLTGLENLRYFNELAGQRHAGTRLEAYLSQAGLPLVAARQRASTYSKGMRQKVGIAIALAKGARALLLDEPTSGLDPKAAHEFSRLLVEVAGEGVAVLMATHDLFRAKEVARRVGVLREGRLVRELTTAGLTHSELERAVLVHEAVLDLVGAGIERQARFRDQVRAGISRWREFFVPKMFHRERLTATDFERWPRFAFAEESASAVAARVAGPLAGILTAAGLLGVWGLARVRRYPVVGE